MLDFKEPALTDKPWIDDILAKKLRNADLCFTNIYLWKDGLNTRISRVGDRLIMKMGRPGREIYIYPAGKGEIGPAIEAMKEDAFQSGNKFTLRGIPSSEVSVLAELYKDKFEFTVDEASSDYVYRASVLADPSGKKLHAKKNHINRFIAENDWNYEAISESNLAECEELTAEWLKMNGDKLLGTVLDERTALKRLFEDYASLGLEGGILYAGGRAVAYTVGEVLSADTYVTHFEKAYADVNGAYPMINREFARQIMRDHPEIIYINREEDMGIENLRRAKQSYYPEFMVEKYVGEWR